LCRWVRGEVFDECGCFCSSRRRRTRSERNWSAEVCSSDLALPPGVPPPVLSLPESPALRHFRTKKRVLSARYQCILYTFCAKKKRGGRKFSPLSHRSPPEGAEGLRHFGRLPRSARSRTKKASSSAEASAARRPRSTAGRWLNGRANRSVTDPQQPALGSAAPYTTRRSRLLVMAPAHMGQGARGTKSAHTHSRQPPRAWQARSMASSSAWWTAFFSVSRVLWAAATISPRRTTTAPTGTSP